MMSAGSPRHSRSQSRGPSGCVTVSPQPVTDPTILDSVAGFINEVATYNVPCDTKDQIQWARFEQLDCEAVLENLNGDKIIPSALILVLGYSTGMQVWAIPANGEAVELLAWRHGSVKVLRLLPSPYIVGLGSQPDIFATKRPLMALCDTTAPGPHHCALSFLSLKTGEQVKVIKFKNAILDVLANRRSVVVTFSERIAIFDAFTLEDRLTVTTCYLSPGIYPNPVALGARWMAYAEKKLISNRRSSGGNEGEGVQSYTATVLHAAKSLGKGLRELGETVASSLTGNQSFKPGTSPGSSQPLGGSPSDTLQKGVITILDIENQPANDKTLQTEGVVAHFAAHSEAIVCLAFDPSGLLLLTADKRGHDFHLFRIHPHPGGSALAAVHHLYILHRGDTTARVQDMCFSPDSRWVGVSTLRGTTHVFPVTPYGGNVGVRTHATPHVVNRMSRFHRSAGLPVEGRSNSPVSLFEAPVNSNLPYNNPRLPPYPHPTVVHPLAQIRQPLFIPATGNIQPRPHGGRPRLNSSSEDNIQVALRLCCCFAPARAWFDNVSQSHDTSVTKQQAKPVESLFIMSCHGTLLQYDLDPHPLISVPKEKVCDETPIELTVHAKAQWVLQRQLHLIDVPLPMSSQNLNLLPQDISLYKSTKPSHTDDRWLSQVEIVTHAGPHRRLWMGPQFTFKTYTTTNGSPASLNEVQTMDVGRSKPVNMPVSTTYPILIESGSASSCEQSPKLLETYQRLSEEVGGAGEIQLREDLADAMLESPGVRESGGRCVIVSMKPHTTGVAKVVNPLGTVVTIHSDDDNEVEVPEDAIIHENCDEALFRPVVAPKPLLFAENKSRITNKIRASISETVKTKPINKDENGRKIKPKMESSVKVEESDVVESGKGKCESPKQSESKGKQSKSNKSDSKYQSKSEIKIDLKAPKIDPEPTHKYEPIPQVEPVPKIESAPKIKPSKTDHTPKSETTPLKEPIPKMESTRNSELTPKIESIRKIEITPIIEPIKKVEPKPKIEPTRKIELTPTIEPTSRKTDLKPKIETIRKIELTPTIESTQNIELKPKIESTRKIELTPLVEPTRKNEVKPKVELTPKIEPLPKAESPPKVVPTSKIEPPPKIETTPKNSGKTSKIIEKGSKIIIEKTSKIFVEIPDIFEESPKIIETTPKCVEPISKKSKSKSKGLSSFLDKERDSDGESKKSLDSKSNVDSRASNKEDKAPAVLKALITTPDLMDNIDTFDFPFSLKKSKNKEKPIKEEIVDFPPFPKHEDLLKEEKFEDARDTEDILDSFSSTKVEKEIKSHKSAKYQGLEPDEVVFSSEEEKTSSNKKPRKPKAKLGVRLSKGKENSEKTEKEIDNCPVEITLPAPRKTWSSIVAPKAEPEVKKVTEEEPMPILDLPDIEDIESVEEFDIELPKKSYSTVAKQHLFEIDPHEDVCESGILLPEKIYKSNTKRNSDDFSLLKVDSKLSDDEKQENGSSQTETTESDDSSKVIAMDTEEDSCQPEVTKTSRQGTEKTVKRKSKKKKR